MLKTLDVSMLGLPHDLRTLAPLCRLYGIPALSAAGNLLEDAQAARETDAVLRDNGLSWGLMPMPADFYSWELGDEAFEEALKALERRAAAAEALGIRYAYNHVWSSGPRPYDENFEWHVRRLRRVSRILHEHGIRYGLEFLGPHELQRLQPHPFIHTLAGILALADAADTPVGVAFDTFHWYCSSNGDRDALLYMEQHIDRLVMLMTGKTYIQEVLFFPQMRPEKVAPRDKVEAFTALGMPADWVPGIQSLGYLTVASIASLSGQKLRQMLFDLNKKYKLDWEIPTLDAVTSWIAKAAEVTPTEE